MSSNDSAGRIPVSLETAWITGRDVRLHVRAAGPDDGPAVVLLHGFPEYWYGWRHQIAPFVEAGYRVLVPDQRGYNRSDAPSAVTAYDLDLLAEDVCCLLDGVGRDRAHVVGHDWGGAVAWHLAMTQPDRIRHLGILNVLHPRVFLETLRTNPAQMVRSLYAVFFQVPRVPEWILGRRDGQGLAWLLRRSSRPGTFTGADLAAYQRAWARPGRLRGMLNWYRAGARRALRSRIPGHRVEVPTLVVWGAQDVALTRAMADRSVSMCPRGELVVLEDATHWVQHDAPKVVNRALLHHLGSE